MKKITFNTEIYSDNIIQAAVEAYKNLAHIRLRIKGDKAELTFSRCLFDEAKTIHEFENYLIGLENQK